ncbi:MAG TPA: TetR/AcrR family transcriptional regulator [Smithella sp.]|nr:TetR/AcrR family transcriptional regulator [Smithella sp.]
MPPKREHNAEDIINAALEVVREQGFEKLSTRTIAEKLHSSTMPIYYSGITMSDIEKEIVTKAWTVLEEYRSKVWTGDRIFDLIIGFVMFSKEEKNLFKCFRNEKLTAVNIVNAETLFRKDMELIKDHDILKKLSPEQAMDVLIQGWIFANGIALVANSPVKNAITMLDSEESITKFVKDAMRIYWRGAESIWKENKEKTSGNA